MEYDATLVEEALASEKPLIWWDLRFLALFMVVFAVVTVVGSVLISAANLLASASGAIRRRDQVRERTRPDAASYLQVVPSAHSGTP